MNTFTRGWNGDCNSLFTLGWISAEATTTEFIAVGGWLDERPEKPKIRGNDDLELVSMIVAFLNSV